MPQPPDLPESHQRPWEFLHGADEAEIWVANSNLELNFYLEQARSQPDGQGICFVLELGGEVFLHTTSEGMLLLDVTPEAAWVAPIISACTGAQPGRGQIWVLPEDTLIQLLLGLNSLIQSSTIVLQHRYGMIF